VLRPRCVVALRLGVESAEEDVGALSCIGGGHRACLCDAVCDYIRPERQNCLGGDVVLECNCCSKEPSQVVTLEVPLRIRITHDKGDYLLEVAVD
jgi:hypothetical protein